MQEITKRKRLSGKRLLAICLVLSMLLPLLPGSAQADDQAGPVSVSAHADCEAASTAAVSDVTQLQTVINKGGDVVLSGGELTVTSGLSVPAGKTVHITVAEGATATLKRGRGYNGDIFTVASGATLILGDGTITYNVTQEDITASSGDRTGQLVHAAQRGDYTVESKGGELVVDGGAVWEKSQSWKPGDSNVEDSTGRRALLYDEEGTQNIYTNTTGLVATGSLVKSGGTLNLWGGVTLQNNASRVDAGCAVYSDSLSTFNMYGGQIAQCVCSSNAQDTGRGAVFVGNFNNSQWNGDRTAENTHFNMYGGAVTRNAAVGTCNSGTASQDGGGISVEQAYMDLYGGEVSYNHAGTGVTTGSGDGGGIMVRGGSQFTMWENGRVKNNFAGGYGGGIVAWNATVTINGGEITENIASYGGGLAIASGNNNNSVISSKATVAGGVIAYNEAIDSISTSAGCGGGICVGTGTRVQGCTLDLTGGLIQQNKAVNGGGVAIYAGGAQTEDSIRNTSAKASGDFQMTSNTASLNGNGMYICNTMQNQHYLLKLSGNASIDTNNPVYFQNLCENQVPVLVEETLTTSGTAAIFELSQDFWNKTANYTETYNGVNVTCVPVSANLKLVNFADGKDVQENKIALESTDWYLSKNDQALTFQSFAEEPLYTIRNGKAVTVDGLAYYRVYQNLADAAEEAEDGDTLYIFYNTTIDRTVTVNGKNLTLLAESTSSASRAASLSGQGGTKTCWLDTGTGYDIMEGNFLKYVGSGGNQPGGKYDLTTDADNTLTYNIRNDYTITLSRNLYLGENTKTSQDGEGNAVTGQEAAVMVYDGASLEVGQVAEAGMGAGKLTFDGNLSYPKEGPMFQAAGTLTFHDGITVMGHSNYSEAHPGVIEVKGGTLNIEDGVTLRSNVSPVAGAVYVNADGTFNMKGGAISGNYGAMPRYGFTNTAGGKVAGYDGGYWGQGKYYEGAGAVYNLGTFTMTGGEISGNRGEYGAVAAMGNSTLSMTGGSVTGNHALTGDGMDSEDSGDHLQITGYTEGDLPSRGDNKSDTAGCGGGVYIGGAQSVTVGGSAAISGNTAEVNGGGIALGAAADVSRSIQRYTSVPGALEFVVGGTAPAQKPEYTAWSGTPGTVGAVNVSDSTSIVNNTAGRLGGGIYNHDVALNVTTDSALRGNTAAAGGGLAAEGTKTVTVSTAVTGNTAGSYGGGVYVGAGASVTVQGDVTDNTAAHGGGAFIDSFARTDAGITAPGETGTAQTSGKLTMEGAYLNNNKVTGSGLGIGLYNRGDVVLKARGDVQPYVSANDRVYLAKDHVVTLDSSYEPTRQAERDMLTVLSEVTANGTVMVNAANKAQAEQVHALLTHGGGSPLALDENTIKINQLTITYYKGTQAGSDSYSSAYAPGADAVLLSYNFENPPAGKSFLQWARGTFKDGTWVYLDTAGNETASETEAAKFDAGKTLTGIQENYSLVAVYTNTSYRATIVYDESNGGLTRDTGAPSVVLSGADVVNNVYTYGMGTTMAVQAPAGSEDAVLQAVEIYEQTPGKTGGETINGTEGWFKVAEGDMDSTMLTLAEADDGNAAITETVKSTGKLAGVKYASDYEGEKLALSDGNLQYKAYDGDIIVKVRYIQPKVSLTVNTPSGENRFSGYFESLHEGVTYMVQKMQEADDTLFTRGNDVTLKLLRENKLEDDGEEPFVRFYGTGALSDQLRARVPVTRIPKDFVSSHDISYTIDLNGKTLRYDGSGQRIIDGYHLTVKNGKVKFESLTGTITTVGEDSCGYGLPMAGYRVESGMLSLEEVEIQVNEPTAEERGNGIEEFYSIKVMESANLEVGKGCSLGNVYIHTDHDPAKIGTEQDDSAMVTVTSNFNEERSEQNTVATLHLKSWNFGTNDNGKRQVFRLATGGDLDSSVGPNIRRLFRLEDISTEGDNAGQNAEKWFIGTDGKLYKKVAQIVPSLVYEENGESLPCEGNVDVDWNEYTSEWQNGYPVYAEYQSIYGETKPVMIKAQLLDAYGEKIPLSRGTVSFAAVRVTGEADNYTTARQASGMVAPDGTGLAKLSFDALRNLAANHSNETYRDHYMVSAAWTGAIQYAPQYALFWNYNYSNQDTTAEPEQDHKGYSGNTLTSTVRLIVNPKPLSDESVQIESVTPSSAQYIGEAGLEKGYSSAPTIGRITDNGAAMALGTDANAFYVAVVKASEKLETTQVVTGDTGAALTVTVDGVVYNYLAGENGGKIYYRVGGSGAETGKDLANAKKINSADAGDYLMGLEAETLGAAGNYIDSGEKGKIFTIEPYRQELNLTGPNHVTVDADDTTGYKTKLQAMFTAARDAETPEAGVMPFTIQDRYGNELKTTNCTFRFETVSGEAKLDAEGWPSGQGLYNLVVTANANAPESERIALLEDEYDQKVQNPNYATSAAGYMAVLITNTELTVDLTPQQVTVPYTGSLYTNDIVKTLDGAENGYTVTLKITGSDEDGRKLAPSEYRLEIGSPKHKPVDVGTYTMVVTDASGQYTGIGNLVIEEKPVTSITLAPTSGVYTGSNHTPTVTVAADSVALVLNRDYGLRVTTTDNSPVAAPVNAGTYTYTATGLGNYGGSNGTTYTVAPKNLDNSDCAANGVPEVIVDAPNYIFTRDQGILVDYDLYYNGMALRNGEDFELKVIQRKNGSVWENTSYTNMATDQPEPGTYKFVLEALDRSNYTGETSFEVTVAERAGELTVQNTQEYVYNGGTFLNYAWRANAVINFGGTTSGTGVRLEIDRCDISLAKASDPGTPLNLNTDILDAGVYIVTVTAQEDYAQELREAQRQMRTEPLFGQCILRIDRCPVTITVAEQHKTYGERDSIDSTKYTTNLGGNSVRGFYAHDTASIGGAFSRNSGENVQNGGYRYTLGTFTAGSNYILSVSTASTYHIDQKDIQTGVTVNAGDSFTYSGYAPDVVRSVIYSNTAMGDLALHEEAQYELTYEQKVGDQYFPLSQAPADVGEYRVTIDCDECTSTPDNYIGTLTAEYSITNSAQTLILTVDGGNTVTYDGQGHKPVISVTTAQGNLVSPSNYNVTYSYVPVVGQSQSGTFVPGKTTFTAAGTCTITVQGTGNYRNSVGTTQYVIQPKNIGDDNVTFVTLDGDGNEADEYIFAGSIVAPSVKGTYQPDGLSALEMAANTDYTLAYANHNQVGTATVTVTGQGNYTGSKQVNYEIVKDTVTVTVGNNTKLYGELDPVYTYTVDDAHKTVQLFGTAGREQNANSENVDTYDLHVGSLSAGSNYDVELAAGQTLTINPKPLVKAGSNELAENISINVPTVLAADANITAENVVNYITANYWAPMGQQTLASGTDYAVTVSQNGNPVTGAMGAGSYTVTIAGEGNYTDSYSADVQVVDADKIIDKITEDTSFTKTYSPKGHVVTIAPTIKGAPLTVSRNDIHVATSNGTSPELTQTADGYQLTLTDVGTYTVTVNTASGDDVYFGTVTYTVTPKDISEAATDVTAEADPISYDYTGAAIEATAKLVYEDATLVKGTDYVCTYSNNVNPSTDDAKAVMTVHGQGNYTGSRALEFSIGETRYRIVYDKNGAEGAAPEDSVLYQAGGAQQPTMKTAAGLTRAYEVDGQSRNAVFVGWSASYLSEVISDLPAGVVYYQAGTSYTVSPDAAVDGKITLYAIWATDNNNNGKADCLEDTYSLSYAKSPDTAEGAPPNGGNYIPGAVVTVGASSIHLDGYQLMGWTRNVPDAAGHCFTTAALYQTFIGSNTVYPVSGSLIMGAQNTVLYPVWGIDDNGNGTVDWQETGIDHYIMYFSNGGSNSGMPANSSVDSEAKEVVVAPQSNQPNRAAHIFLGWTREACDPLGRDYKPADGDDLHKMTIGGKQVQIYHSGDKYTITDADSTVIGFYALWAENANQNTEPDYQEELVSVKYVHDPASGVVVNGLPDAQEELAGTTVQLSSQAPAGTLNGETVQFLGWTTTAADAAKTYGPDDVLPTHYPAGAAYQIASGQTGAIEFYALWGNTDYGKTKHTVTVMVVGGHGSADIDNSGHTTTQVLDGKTCTIYLKPDDGYQIGSVVVNGAAQTVTTPLTLTITDTTYVVVTYMKSSFAVTMADGADYNATAQRPAVTVTDGAKTLVYGTDYTVDYGTGDYTAAGSYTVTVTGMGTYAGSSQKMSYVIRPAAFQATTATNTAVYNGQAQNFGSAVTGVNGAALTKDTDYTVRYQDADGRIVSEIKNVGFYTMTFTGVGNYAGDQIVNVQVTPNTQPLEMVQPENRVYTGDPYLPTPEVTVDGTVLTLNTDYTLEHETKPIINVGTYTVTAQGIGNYSGTASKGYEITPKNLEDSEGGTINVTVMPVIYSGEENTPQIPTIVVTYTTTEGRVLYLVEGVDYDCAYENNTEICSDLTYANAPKVTITGKGNYTGSIAENFKINGKTFTRITTPAPKTYNGKSQHTSQYQVFAGELQLSTPSQYRLDHYEAIESTGASLAEDGRPLTAGTYIVHVKGRGDYKDYTGTTTFVIEPKDLLNVTVTESGMIYDGMEKRPTATVTSGLDIPLTEDDYRLVYQNNMKAGTAVVTAIGQGNYTGTVSTTFEIGKQTLYIEPTDQSKTYGEHDGTLGENGEYALGYRIYNAEDEAVTNVTLEGKLTREAGEAANTYAFNTQTLRDPSGNYALALKENADGSEPNFTIEKKSLEDADHSVESALKDTTVTVGYTGTAYMASPVTVYGSAYLGRLTLTAPDGEDGDYQVSYSKDGQVLAEAPTAAGTYVVTVSGRGNYAGSYQYTLVIDDQVLGATMGGKDQQTYNGSDWRQFIQDNLSVSFGGTQYYLSGDTTAPADAKFYTLKYLNEAGTEVAAIKDAGNYTIEVTGPGVADAEQTVTLSFTVLRKNIDDSTVTADAITAQAYDGSAKEPTVSLTDSERTAVGETITESTDYTVTYENNVNVGTATVAITGQGNYQGTRNETFTIDPLTTVQVGSVADVVYNGQSQRQKPTVTATLASGSVTLTENADYTLSYSDNTVDVGTVNVTITGLGNYAGVSESRSYKITPKTIETSWIRITPNSVTYTGSEQEPPVTVTDPALGSILVADKDYTVTYADNINKGTAKVTIQGIGNYTGTPVQTFEITADTSGLLVEPSKTVVYNGADQKPQLTVTHNGQTLSQSDYTVAYSYNGAAQSTPFETAKFVDVGVYVITVTGQNSHDGASGTAVFVITPGTFTVDAVSPQNYTGAPIEPKPAVRDQAGNWLAEENYELFYSNNVNIGTAVITVVGRGNYAGCVQQVNFEIKGDSTVYHVLYYGNNHTSGTLPSDPSAYVRNALVTVRQPGANFGRSGAVFLGWSTQRCEQLIDTQSLLNGLTVYRSGESFQITDNVLLYALWAVDNNHNGVPDYLEQVQIAASALPGGTITPSGWTTWNIGTAAAEFHMQAAQGYVFAGAVVDGTLVHVSSVDTPTNLRRNADGTFTYTFTDVREQHSIVAAFREVGAPDQPTDPNDSGVSDLLDTSNHRLYMQGRDTGFCPDANITRAEVAMIFYRLLRNPNVTITKNFPDVPAGRWYTDAINTLASLEILQGDNNGNFRPDDPITRAEFATITARLAAKINVGTAMNFTDVPASHWAYANIQLNAYHGWVNGYPDGTFRPEKAILRSEAAKIVNYMTGRLPDKAAIDSGKGTRFGDVAQEHWAFYHIVEAGTTHDFTKADNVETWKNV